MALPNYNNILVVRTDRIGDVVLTTPVFKALRQAYPGARICVLVRPATVDLVRKNPYIDEVLVDDQSFLSLARSIRLRQFDCAFIFHTKRRYNLACFLAGVPHRWGYKNEKYGFLLNHSVKDTRHTGQQHESQYCLDLLKSAGIPSAEPDLFIPAQKDAEAWASQWFEANHLKPGTVVAIHPGASDPQKCWAPSHFAALINALRTRYDLNVVLIGGGETRAISADIRQMVKFPIFDLTGQISVAQMASVLRRCRILISNDSGPMHVAAAVGIFVVGLYLRDRPGINPQRWSPLGAKAFILVNKEGDIKVEEVLELIERIFRQDSQSLFYW